MNDSLKENIPKPQINPELDIVRDLTSGSIYTLCIIDCRPPVGEKTACINVTA